MKPKVFLLAVVPTLTIALYIPPVDTSLTAENRPYPQNERDFVPSETKREQIVGTGRKRKRGSVGSEATQVVQAPSTLTAKIGLPQSSAVPTQNALAPLGKPHEYQFNKEVTNKLGQLTTSSIDLVAPGVVLTTACGITWYLYRHGDASGLVAGAAASGDVLMLIQVDATTSQPLLITMAAIHLGFHTAYCNIVAKSLAYADGFIAVTIMAATVVLVMVAHLPSLAHLWKESSGVPLLWAIFPLHVISVYFGDLAVRVTRWYCRLPGATPNGSAGRGPAMP